MFHSRQVFANVTDLLFPMLSVSIGGSWLPPPLMTQSISAMTFRARLLSLNLNDSYLLRYLNECYLDTNYQLRGQLSVLSWFCLDLPSISRVE